MIITINQYLIHTAFNSLTLGAGFILKLIHMNPYTDRADKNVRFSSDYPPNEEEHSRLVKLTNVYTENTNRMASSVSLTNFSLLTYYALHK
jgi:hypothetical protein